MYKLCADCHREYIEEDEEICLKCQLYIDEENEYIHSLEDYKPS